MQSFREGWLMAMLSLGGMALPVRAQMDMRSASPEMAATPLGIPETRAGSGTSWLPDASSMEAAHLMRGSWSVMLHGHGFLQYVFHSDDGRLYKLLG